MAIVLSGMAQLAAHLVLTQKVPGSIPGPGAQCVDPFRDRLTAGREVLALAVGVRVLFPEREK